MNSLMENPVIQRAAPVATDIATYLGIYKPRRSRKPIIFGIAIGIITIAAAMMGKEWMSKDKPA